MNLQRSFPIEDVLKNAEERNVNLAEHVGFVVDKVGLGQVFSEYFGFPCQSSFH
jgi:hypothetical protein